MNFIRSRKVIVGTVVALLVLVGLATWSWWPQPSPHEIFDHGIEAAGRNDLPELLRSADRLQGREGYEWHEHLLRGLYCLKTDRPSEALVELKGLRPEGELRDTALLVAGEAMYRTDRLPEAQRLFATLTSEQPGHVEAHRWLAAIAYDLGAMNQAMDEMEIVIRLQPSDYRPYLLRGHILFDQERFAPAVKEYSQALATKPPENIRKELVVALARSQVKTREYAAALETLAHRDPTTQVLTLRAECHSGLGNAETAWKTIEEARRLKPDDLEVLRVLARLELDAGRPESAVTPLQRILDRDPHDYESRHELAQAFRLLGKTLEAETESHRAGETIELKRKLASLTIEAIQHPTDASLREQMAEICDVLGKRELAASWRKAAAACRFLAQPTK